jgi:hypothetical protein
VKEVKAGDVKGATEKGKEAVDAANKAAGN